MNDQIPDGITSADLLALMENAQSETVTDMKSRQHAKAEDPITDFEELCRLAHAAKEELFAACGNPLGMKMLALMVAEDMIAYHNKMAHIIVEQTDDIDLASTWMADAGQWIVVKNTIQDVELGRNDPTPRWKAPEDN